MTTSTLETKPQEKREIARTPELTGYPFGLVRRFSTEFDRILEDFGFRPHFGALLPEFHKGIAWTPAVEILEREGEFVVRADLPGMKKEDVKVNIAEDCLTLEGERKHEEKETREGYFRSERTYGAFTRTIALPEGAIADGAQAVFKDGVLEITVPVPPRTQKKARAIEVKTT